MMRHVVLAVALAGQPVTAATPAKTPTPVKEAWDKRPAVASAASIRRNPVPGRPAAGYLSIAGGGQPDRLLAVTAPGLRIEMHAMTMTGGIMAMHKLEALPVPAGNSVAFQPGGKHLMIFGLAAGSMTVPLTLVFASGARVTVSAAVRNVSEPAAMVMGAGKP